MLKRVFSVVLACVLVLSLGGRQAHAGDRAGNETRILVTSDLHFTLQSESSIYPLMDQIENIVEVLAEQVIKVRPDALILCGDNCNSGRASDVRALTDILRRIREAGVPVIAVPGNHDFDLSDAEGYAEAYGFLCDPEEKDKASLSYMLHIGPFRVLAMDDSSTTGGRYGWFSPVTMTWLQQQLIAAREAGEKVLFLSHHTVLPGGVEAEDSSYLILNSDLAALLGESGVLLCLSGHRHSQEVLTDGKLYEIVSAMPVSYPHQIGSLSIGESELDYRTIPLDFSNASKELSGVLQKEREEQWDRIAVVDRIDPSHQFSQKDRLDAARLFSLFMIHFGEGSLADVQAQILADPGYEAFMRVFADTNYGPWMSWTLNQTWLPGNRLQLRWD